MDLSTLNRADLIVLAQQLQATVERLEQRVRELEGANARPPQPQPISMPQTQPASVSSTPITLIFDGGSLGNPGKGYGSVLLGGFAIESEPIRLNFDGKKTNNEAEYLTLIHGLKLAVRTLESEGRSPRTTSIRVMSDSNLVVEQVNGRWKVRNERLQPLHKAACQALAMFGDWSLEWHSRRESVRLLGH